MTSPASASFPWSQAPEPPSGEFRAGRLPSHLGGDYLAARGARPGPALLLLVAPAAGFAAIHGLFRLAEALDARRLAGSLLIRVAADGSGSHPQELLEAADALVAFAPLRPGWRELPVASYALSGKAEVDRRAGQLASATGAPYCYGATAGDQHEPVAWMAGRGGLAVRLRMPCAVDERAETVERVFQGLIDILRVLGMLEGQLSPIESRELQPPAYAEAPVAGYWSPAARPGQRIRIDDRLGSFHDGQGHELGNFLTNVSGLLLGISDEVWIEPGQPLAALARPAS
jgi:hypothetical protein